jgi:predicted transcriptional regulator
MRTTLTLDDDVAAILKRLARTRNARFKDVVNDALRRGLASTTAVPARKTFRTASVDLGRCRTGSVDNVADALAAAEGESFR